jgi:hypothetical protein
MEALVVGSNKRIFGVGPLYAKSDGLSEYALRDRRIRT